MKTIAKLILALALFTSHLSHGSGVGRSPEQMMGLFDEYLAHVTSQQQGPVWLEYGRQKFLARAVIAQIAAMRPDDFNALMFLMMERYVNKPAERQYLFNFLSATTESLSADLEYSRALQAGPQALMLEGSYKYGIWLLIAGHVVFKVALSRNVKGLADLMRQLRQREVALTEMNKFYGLSYRVATSPTTWLTVASTAGGAGLGALEHLIQSSGTHRLNPMIATMVVQAQLACHLSYQGLAVQEEFESVKNDPAKLKEAKPALLEQITTIAGQGKVLAEQYSRLENLDVRDRLFKKVLEQYPTADNWQKFRTMLTEAETSQNGQCRQMSMLHLKNELDKTAAEIRALVPEDTPAVPGAK